MKSKSKKLERKLWKAFLRRQIATYIAIGIRLELRIGKTEALPIDEKEKENELKVLLELQEQNQRMLKTARKALKK